LGSCRVTSDFPGTISLKGRTIKNVIYGVGSSLAKWKFKYILICNFHMDLAHVRAIRMGMKKVERKYGIKIYEPSSPYFYNKLVQAKERVNFDTIADLHACFRETSLMMETHPYLLDNCYKKLPKVAINTERPSALWKTLKEMGASNGYIGNPSKAKKDYGKWLLKELVEWHAKCVIDMLDNKEMLDLPKKMKWIMKLFVRL
jgi:creatinine amidohydrolase